MNKAEHTPLWTEATGEAFVVGDRAYFSSHYPLGMAVRVLSEENFQSALEAVNAAPDLLQQRNDLLEVCQAAWHVANLNDWGDIDTATPHQLDAFTRLSEVITRNKPTANHAPENQPQPADCPCCQNKCPTCEAEPASITAQIIIPPDSLREFGILMSLTLAGLEPNRVEIPKGSNDGQTQLPIRRGQRPSHSV